VEMYRLRGVRFVPSLDEVPERATIVFSAHGVAPDVRAEAERRGMRIVDATCPFVTKVHSEVKRYARNGYSIVMIGHRRHDEVLGVAGEAPGAVAVVENEAEAASFTPAKTRTAWRSLRRQRSASRKPNTSRLCLSRDSRRWNDPSKTMYATPRRTGRRRCANLRGAAR